MDDTIYREAAVKHLKHRLYETATNNPDIAGVFSEIADNRVETWIEELPSAQQRWIPVTERLPEEDGTYIVCLDDRSVFEYDYISKWWDDDAWQYCGKDVVAWMPLPDPWKGGEE